MFYTSLEIRYRYNRYNILDLSKEGIIDAPPTEAAVGNVTQGTCNVTSSSTTAFLFKLNSVANLNSLSIYKTTKPAIASTMDMNKLLSPTLAAAPVNGCTEAEGL